MGSVTASGVITTAGHNVVNARVEIWTNAANAHVYALAVAVTSNATGKFAAQVRSNHTFSYQARYAGSGALSGSVSRTATITVDRIGTKIYSSGPVTASYGGAVKMTGALADSHGNRLVGQTLQIWFKYAGTARWWLGDYMKTTAGGHYTYTLPIMKYGLDFQVRFLGSTTYAGSSTASARISVPAPHWVANPKLAADTEAAVNNYRVQRGLSRLKIVVDPKLRACNFTNEDGYTACTDDAAVSFGTTTAAGVVHTWKQWSETNALMLATGRPAPTLDCAAVSLTNGPAPYSDVMCTMRRK